jgi:hypothetical protein
MAKDDEVADPEALALAHDSLGPDSPGHLIRRFIDAIAGGQLVDAQLCIAPECRADLIEFVLGTDFITSGTWGLWGVPEVAGAEAEIVTVVDMTGRDDDALFVAANSAIREQLSGVRFLVEFRDGGWLMRGLLRGSELCG